MSKKRSITKRTNSACYCGLPNRYDHCCGVFHSGQAYPETAEQLMRSRYSAFATSNLEYLILTWSKATCPNPLELDQEANWIKLKVIETHKGLKDDIEGKVSFIATYKTGGKAHKLKEHSRFVRENSKWVYQDGDPLD